MNKQIPAAVKVFLTAALAFSTGLPGASATSSPYQKMADDFASYCAAKKVKNIAVLGFSRKAQTTREESEYVSEKLLAGLSRSGKVNLLERGQLDRVLAENKLGLIGIARETPGAGQLGVRPTDVVITGTVFGTDENLQIIAKMIDRRTGAVLHMVEAQAERQPEMVPPEWSGEIALPELGSIPPVAFGKEFNAYLGDFRDAPAGLSGDNCGDRRERLAGRQSAALEAKAKYWALKMREPGFRVGDLRRNPGAEIKDGGMRKKFYELLRQFYRAPREERLSGEESGLVESVMREESRLADECGGM